jgi:hypothetical protein
MGEAMPKMSSKVTMKIEPKLLETISVKAEAEGLAVSSYIRKAVISYIGERLENNPRSIRFEMTSMEIRVINKLLDLGVVKTDEDVFHNALNEYLRCEYDKVVSRAKDMMIEDHISRDKKGNEPFAVNNRTDLDEGIDVHFVTEEGDVDK